MAIEKALRTKPGVKRIYTKHFAWLHEKNNFEEYMRDNGIKNIWRLHFYWTFPGFQKFLRRTSRTHLVDVVSVHIFQI